MGMLGVMAGCGSKETVTLDYANYPENFMIMLKPDTNYVLKNGAEESTFCATTHAVLKSNQILTYNDKTLDLSSAVYYRKTEPVLVHMDGKDYFWICEQTKEGRLIAATFIYSNMLGYLASDNGMLNMTMGDAVLDPKDFMMEANINCFGNVTCCAHYFVNENAKPERIDSGDLYDYVSDYFVSEKLVLDEDINTWVYESKDATESTIEVVPAGTVFTRLRVPNNAEYSYVEALLEDGRVMRVVEEYWFSEPSAYQAMMDYDKKQFTYSAYGEQSTGPIGFTGMK